MTLLHLPLKDKGDIEDYLSVNFGYLQDGRINISQTQIVPYSIKQVNLPPNVKTRQTPVLATKILLCNVAAPKFYERFQYCGAI